MRGVFLQVRLDSSRLPRKALLKLAGQTVIGHAMQALSGMEADVRSLLTTEDSAETLRPLAKEAGWELFIGPKEDVLARYVLAAREFGIDCVVRATGDNPLVSASMASKAVELAAESGAHYAGFADLPLGTGVEVLDAAALEEAFSEAVDSYEREHVSPFLYRRPQRYRIEVPKAPGSLQAPGGRVTLDTLEDYQYLSLLFADLYRGTPPELSAVVRWLRENPRDGG